MYCPCAADVPLQEGAGAGGAPGQPVGKAKYSSLSQSHDEWAEEDEQPCSGERMLLLFDRCISWSLWHAC